MTIENEEQFIKYRNKIIKEWKPIIQEERERSGDINKAFRRNWKKFYDDFSPLFEYSMITYMTERISNLADVKEIVNG